MLVSVVTKVIAVLFVAGMLLLIVGQYGREGERGKCYAVGLKLLVLCLVLCLCLIAYSWHWLPV